jgi:hypothetical protein
MNASAIQAEKLARIQTQTRRAWQEYHERVRFLRGDEYDSVEDASWLELQDRLSALEHHRRLLDSRTPKAG